MEGLILEGMGQFVGHDAALFVGGNPIGDIEFLRLRVVEPGNLLGENIEHEGIERKILGDEAESFEGFAIGVALSVVAVFLFLANQVGADFLPRAEAFLERLLDGQAQELAHFREDFVGGAEKFGVGVGVGLRRGRRQRGSNGFRLRRRLLGQSGHRKHKQQKQDSESLHPGLHNDCWMTIQG